MTDSRVQWCRDTQAWALDQLRAGECPRELAVLGMSDALLEEVLIEAEECGNVGCV